MSILNFMKNGLRKMCAEVKTATGFFFGVLYFFSVNASAGCGYVDIANFSMASATNRFLDGGYAGFWAQAGKNVADCYANKLNENGKLGTGLLYNLNLGNSTDAINKLRGLKPDTKLLVAHRGGPDWANGIPDNSVSAFQRSIASGISSVEVDLQMDSKRNLIAYHDASFSGTVSTSNLALQEASKKGIQDYEWITRSKYTRKLDDSKLLQLRRIIPNSFINYELGNNTNPILKISPAASTADSSIVVSSFQRVLDEIQSKSLQIFGSRTAVNIFVDAAKSREITIAAISHLRRLQLIAGDKMYNDVNSTGAAPQTESVAVQFRVNHFPGGADDLVGALCASDENKIIYKKLVTKLREKVYHPKNWPRYRDYTYTSYTDSTDNFASPYGSSVIQSGIYSSNFELPVGMIYNNGNPSLRLWGDAASGTCVPDQVLNSGIALVPVIEENLPNKISVNYDGSSRVLTAPADYGIGVMDFLKPFKRYFKMNIIEFSYTPSDMIGYFSADGKQLIKSPNIKSRDVFYTIAKDATDSTFSTEYYKLNYIYQTFNRYFDINLVDSTDRKYNGPYLCSAQIPPGSTTYEYLCNNMVPGSLEEGVFEYRAKPGFYTGVCNMSIYTTFRADWFGLSTTDNPLLEIYLNGPDFQANASQFGDFCSTSDEGGRMLNYTTRYKSFVGNPSFRLSGGI